MKTTGIDVTGAKVVGPGVRNEHGEVVRDHIRKSLGLQEDKHGLCAEGI